MPLRIDDARNGIGRNVYYRPPGGERVEFGVITSVNSEYVFVRYDGDEHSKATSPWMLDFAIPEGLLKP